MLLDLNADWSVATTYLSDLGIDNKLRQTSSTTGVSYYLTDHLASTAGLTDASGSIVEQLAYDSFGNTTGSARTRYGYTGRERDANTGLIYYRARWHDPQAGRFISEDPMGLNAGSNFYSYVGNNPTVHNDPTGLCPKNQPCDVQIPDERARAMVAVALGEATPFNSAGQYPKPQRTTEGLLPLTEQEFRTEAFYMASVVTNRFAGGGYASYADVINVNNGAVFRGANDGWHRLNQLGNITTVPTLVEQNQLFAEIVQVGLIVC